MDLTTLHYVTFIKPFVMLPIEVISFVAKQFKNNYINKVFESKNNDPFLLLEKHFFAAVVQKKYEAEFEDLPQEVVQYFS
jgi:hypothetical protein